MISRHSQMNIDPQESGMALFLAIIAMFLLMTFTVATLTVVNSHGEEHASSYENMRCLYIAEAGIELANIELSQGESGDLGSETGQIGLEYGEFWVTATANGNGTTLLRCEARINNIVRVVSAVAAPNLTVFHHAIFAGNSSGDPDYVLSFGGSGSQGDEVHGDIYSGQDIDVTGSAEIDGNVTVRGIATGITAQTSPGLPLPDLGAYNYPVNNDVNVASEFDAHGVSHWDNAGGTALQLPASNPAHIFRKNPSDRSSDTSATVKDDYFLEDPYEAPNPDNGLDGTNAYIISLGTGNSNNSGNNANQQTATFYIDGNLWIHNRQTYSFKLANLPQGTQVTFAVRGNIYISDSFFYSDSGLDGVAFVAVEDENVADSGNIYFGDPSFGTLETMYGFMYAENNFHDNNLSTSGSAEVTLNGTMSAGNQVAIDRDSGSIHTKLIVNFDPNLRNGSVDIPGAPSQGSYTQNYSIVSWFRGSVRE